MMYFSGQGGRGKGRPDGGDQQPLPGMMFYIYLFHMYCSDDIHMVVIHNYSCIDD